MSRQDDGGSAFPRSVWTEGPEELKAEAFNNGMSLRDYFAGQVVASQIDADEDDDLAARCYAIADAMLKERQK